jgi:hypothetical protein
MENRKSNIVQAATPERDIAARAAIVVFGMAIRRLPRREGRGVPEHRAIAARPPVRFPRAAAAGGVDGAARHTTNSGSACSRSLSSSPIRRPGIAPSRSRHRRHKHTHARANDRHGNQDHERRQPGEHQPGMTAKTAKTVAKTAANDKRSADETD